MELNSLRECLERFESTWIVISFEGLAVFRKNYDLS